MQRALVLACCACSSHSSGSVEHHGSAAIAPPVGSDASTGPDRLMPGVGADDAVFTPTGPTPLLVVVDKNGTIAFGVGSTWDALASYDPADAVRNEDLPR